MQYRIDKKSGNKISILGFGCMRLPSNRNKIDIDKTEKLFLEAIDKGVNYFDTAYIYPGSEEAIGLILEKNKLRDKVFLATKLPLFRCKKYSDFDKFFNIQLNRLKTDYIDYYFMHMLGTPQQWENLKELGIEKWIDEKKSNGTIKQIGFSFHGKQDDFIELINAYDWDFCQIQYNYININFQAGVTGLKHAASKDIPVFIMEPLLGGRLANGLPDKAVSLFKESNSSLSPVGWALRWIWNQPEVTMLLSGMNEFDQLKENIHLAENSTPNMLTSKEHDTIESVITVFNTSYKIPCTGCNYCMPCPANINIPGCFAAYNSSFVHSKGVGWQQYMMNTGIISPSSSIGIASNCIKCGKCEKHCPQNIEIRSKMDKVKARMEPFWFKPAISIAKIFMK